LADLGRHLTAAEPDVAQQMVVQRRECEALAVSLMTSDDPRPTPYQHAGAVGGAAAPWRFEHEEHLGGPPMTRRHWLPCGCPTIGPTSAKVPRRGFGHGRSVRRCRRSLPASTFSA